MESKATQKKTLMNSLQHFEGELRNLGDLKVLSNNLLMAMREPLLDTEPEEVELKPKDESHSSDDIVDIINRNISLLVELRAEIKENIIATLEYIK